ncbi:phage tail tape measure protein [uncultured Bacteroides sp.]|jgi:hypothetical protein|uniref:phage tail tape measure protein n=1 Tax=uncultured Bacteroides sp. TaxID=162156 RepID=UPI00258BBE1D|nr:phage tail tape measure protein [uncultured Bacteroides sp.]
MAQDLKITDFISEKAFDQVDRFTKDIMLAKAEYAAFAEKLAQQVTIKITGYVELKEKAKGGNAILKELSETQTKLAQIQKDYKDLLKQVSDQTKENVKQILEEAKANKLNADAELALQKVETERLKQQKLLNQERRKLKNTTEEIQKALKTEAKSATEAGEQNRILRKAVRDLDITQEGAIDTIEKYNKKIEENEVLLDKVSDKMIKRKRNIGNYPFADYESIKKVLGMNNEIGDSIFKLAAESDGLSSLTENIRRSTFTLGASLKTLFSNPAFLSIAGISGVGILAKFWYDYNTGLVQATKLTSQFTGKSGDDLKKYRTEIQSVADFYNKDFKETLIATNTLTKQFGISSENALTLLKDGFIAGADANGEFFDYLKEYPAYFKEAGISASQFIAIIAETSKQGIYSDKGLDAIKEGNLRIREMTKSTAEALDKIGLNSIELQKGLQNGALSTFDVMQMVSEKLNQLPDNSREVGSAIANIFGGPGEDAGLQYIRTLKDISTNLDNVKQKTGELGEAEQDLLEAQTKLSTEIALLFDSTGGAFEKMTTKVKTFVNEIAADLIGTIRMVFESTEEMGNRQSEQAKALGRSTINENELNKDISRINMRKETYIKAGKEENEAFSKAKNEHLEILQLSLKQEQAELNKAILENKKYLKEYEDKSFFKQGLGIQRSNSEINADINRTWNEYLNKLSEVEAMQERIQRITSIQLPVVKKEVLTDEELEKLKKQLEEQKRLREEYEQIKLDLMDEGIDKELAKIKTAYAKRISVIKGTSEEENQLRQDLLRKMEEDLGNYEIDYYLAVEKKRLQNKINIVKKGSEEEYNVRLELLRNEEESEKELAIRKNEDITNIEKKYEIKRLELKENYANEVNKKIQEEYTNRSILINAAMSQELDDLTEEYTKGIINAEAYERRKAEIAEKYAIQQAEQAVDLAKKLANTPGISDEDRLKLEQEISKAEIVLAEQVRDAKINASKRTADSIKKEMDKTAESIQAIADLLGGFADLGSAIYDRKIEEIESEQDANDEAYERELERIESLEQKGAISTEEAEARKRAAEEKTASKEAELAKKKAQLQIQQAKLDKTNNIIQTIMNTAVAIMKAWGQAGIFGAPLAAIIAAQGAIQLATIIAQPIPKYAKGTDNHPGGLAIVGDGGRREGILTNKGLFATPSIPTLVDLPKGAAVVPDLEQYISVRPLLRSDLGAMAQDAEREGIPFTVNVDTGALELRKEIRILTDEVRKLSKARRKEAVQRELDYLHRTI